MQLPSSTGSTIAPLIQCGFEQAVCLNRVTDCDRNKTSCVYHRLFMVRLKTACGEKKKTCYTFKMDRKWPQTQEVPATCPVYTLRQLHTRLYKVHSSKSPIFTGSACQTSMLGLPQTRTNITTCPPTASPCSLKTCLKEAYKISIFNCFI